MKPKIKMYRTSRGRIGWICSGGYNLDGYGWTPSDAYNSWEHNEIPF